MDRNKQQENGKPPIFILKILILFSHSNDNHNPTNTNLYLCHVADSFFQHLRLISSFPHFPILCSLPLYILSSPFLSFVRFTGLSITHLLNSVTVLWNGLISLLLLRYVYMIFSEFLGFMYLYSIDLHVSPFWSLLRLLILLFMLLK